MSQPSPNKVFAALNDIQIQQSLSIVRLSESISRPTAIGTKDASTANPRTSDVSLDSASATTPVSLAADVSHYRDLFSKLRFSYLEQVTKEKFLRAIVGDPPLIVEAAENMELESQLKEVKAVLKDQKLMVGRIVEELEAKGVEVVRRYQGVEEKKAVLQTLPTEIKSLEMECEVLRGAIETQLTELGGSDIGQGLGVEEIHKAIREKDSLKQKVERRLEALESSLPAKERQLQDLQGDMEELEKERHRAITGAREAVKGRERGGNAGDELETRGRWLSGCEEGLRGLLGVEAL
ncbi:MAG: hypothetical protein Q9174_001271 [Haloplaca sp. 1 TL-2023]